MSKPVFYTHMSPGVPVNSMAQFQTVGSMITILDFVLVNGGNQLNILSITRTGTVALVETSGSHVYGEDNIVHIENTIEPNFNGKFIVRGVPAVNQILIDVADTGSTSTGAAGTIKNAAAGWTKIISGTNFAVYRSANFYDGFPRFLQVEDNAPYGTAGAYRVRMAKGQTALNTATLISAGRRWEKVTSHGNWLIVADDKTFYLNVNQVNTYMFGYVREETQTDLPILAMSTGLEGGAYGYNFGQTTYFATNQPQDRCGINTLETTTNLGGESLCTISVLGLSGVNNVLSNCQQSCLFANPMTGIAKIANIDLWEKISDSNPTHNLRGSFVGVYQPYGRISSDYISFTGDNKANYFKTLPVNENGKIKKYIIIGAFSTTTQLMFDITGDW